MPTIVDLREGLKKYIQKHGLSKKWEKVKTVFENDPSHPSLKTELLEPRHRLIYSFRIDIKYRGAVYLPSEQQNRNYCYHQALPQVEKSIRSVR